MIVERSMHPEWLSNSYLVAAAAGGEAVLIDSGAPPEPLLEAAERHGLRPTHLLLTHHHFDHVSETAAHVERFGVEVLAHPLEAELLPEGVDRTLDPGEPLEAGGLRIAGLHTPGHTAGMLSFEVRESGGGGDGDGPSHVFTGDTLFKGSVGGVRAPGSTGFADIRRSVMDVLMELPPETRLHPGHADPTTVGEEWESNAFVRVWRGLDGESSEPCRVGEEEATLVLWAPDYDGGHKAWVRWPDGRDDIVPGSAVVRDGEGESG